MRPKSVFTAALLLIVCARCSFAQAPSRTTAEVVSRMPSPETVTELIEKSPNDGRLYFLRAFAYQMRKQYREAIADCTEAIALNCKPDQPSERGGSVYDLRAVCFMEILDYDSALRDLHKAIELSPKDASAYNNLSFIYIERKQFDIAMRVCLKALQLDPSQPTFYGSLGEICFKTHQYERAIQYLNRAIAMDDTMGEAYFYRASTYKALRKETEAVNDFRKAGRLGFKLGEHALYIMK